MRMIKEIVKSQKDFFSTGQTLELSFRIDQLRRLKSGIQAHEAEILNALKEDLNKAHFESYGTEVGLVLEEISYILKHLKDWAQPQKVRTPLTSFPAKSYIYPEPYGVTLIMSPWNYPFMLSLIPLIGALAAGNCAVLKPSAYSAHTSAILSMILRESFSEDYIAVIEGGREVNHALLEEKFDYIFFTGSVEVGKKVMHAAAEHLTPITLELGGKSPCIVDQDANLELAAKRIVWGKFLNAGQTCVAPDYLLVHRQVKENLISRMCRVIGDFYGENPLENPDLPKIINDKHFERLLGYLPSGRIRCGGTSHKEKRLIAPTLLDRVPWEEPVMQEEIFGPLLPILEFESIDEVIGLVNNRPKPLACYFFTQSKEKEEELIRRISFGGGCINDTVIHVASSHLPFGGVGESGMGGYHGKASFNTFSHQKSMIKQSLKSDIPVRYPPYKGKLYLLKKLMK
ncbi:MAG TPA: aldehyde dehydrogenase [Desulfitobacterium dehalogenans]|uniref:Aldehyde dehydrogenase n=1 Tax=Desulfitobacterium dehalogenans TaxID=36854 RepID=A0A7C6Z4T2_9FIRM|nr:aldehyde dehydrogenase [Desulfitobacterium dehalogenans]